MSAAYVIGRVLGALVAGTACGIIPLLAGALRGRLVLGLLGLLCSALAGFLLGLLLAVPTALIFATSVTRK